MKTVEQILEWIANEMLSSKHNMRDCAKTSGMDTPAWGMACGTFDTLRELKEFIEETE